ncbi:MAG TPA: HutD family protein [Albitalea sp.]|nr:HutD family protein [Albitalea sp.]
MSAELIPIDTLTPQRWKNGAGHTRELAIEPRGASLDGFDWRLSVAEVAGDAPFSAYPGIDRCLVVLCGAGMLLQPKGAEPLRLDAASPPFAFPGEEALDARTIDGPCVDFNVMTRRGRWSAEVARVDGPCRVGAAPVLLVLCGAGSLRAAAAGEAAHPLQAMQALLWRDGAPAVRIDPLTADCRALWVRLWP